MRVQSEYSQSNNEIMVREQSGTVKLEPEYSQSAVRAVKAQPEYSRSRTKVQSYTVRMQSVYIQSTARKQSVYIHCTARTQSQYSQTTVREQPTEHRESTTRVL